MTVAVLFDIKNRLKGRLGPLWWYTAVQFALSKAGDIVNLYVGAFLIPAVLSADELGAIPPLRMLMSFALFPMGLLSGAAMKFVNAFHVGDQKSLVKALLRDLSVVAAVLSLGIVLVLWAGQDFVLVRLKLGDERVVWALAAAVVVSYWQTVASTAVQGIMRFRHLILSGMVGPIVYLVLMVLLLRPLQVLGYMIALAGMGLAGALYLGWSVREYIRPGIARASYREHWPQIKRYVVNTGVLSFVTGLAAVVEPWGVRNFVSPMDSAGYYMAFMFGQIPLYLASAFSLFLFPLISARHERGERTEGLFRQSALAMLMVGVPLVAAFGWGGDWLLSLRPSWALYGAYAPFIWKAAVIATLQGIIGAYIAHETACNRFGFVGFCVKVYLLEAVIFYTLMGWAFFRPHLPAPLWGAVDQLLGPRLSFAVWVMLGTRLLVAAYGALHVMRGARNMGAKTAPALRHE